MIFSTCEFRAKSLAENVFVNVLLPQDRPRTEVPVLYLLHGMHGCFNDWVKNTRISLFADRYGIAVIMPSAQNSFYHDMAYGGQKFFTFVTKELPAFAHDTFGLPTDREHTFVAGLSMGGYGAFYLALRNPFQYAGAASLSGAVDVKFSVKYGGFPEICKAILGTDDADKVQGTDSDLFELVRRTPADAVKPTLYACCGTEDSGLYPQNIAFRDMMKERPDFDFRFEEGPGVHNWFFWDGWIERCIVAIIPESLRKPLK